MSLEQENTSQHQHLPASCSPRTNETTPPAIMLDVELCNLKRAYDVPLDVDDSRPTDRPDEEKEDVWSEEFHPIEICESQIDEGEEELGSSKKTYKCCFCSYVGTNSQLQDHSKSRHGEGKKITDHYCEHCQLNFISKAAFKIHRNQEHLFHCKVCNKFFKHQKLLVAHLSYHNEGKGTSFICPMCKKAFSRQRYLVRHLERHDKKPVVVKRENRPRDFKCSDCGSCFTKKVFLFKHTKIHTRESLKCSLCEFTCENRVTLKMHTISHEGARKYKCEHCDFSFKQIGHLRRHIERFKH